MKNKERILNKIRKTIEMANRKDGNEEEAAIAAGMVEKLLKKYNLEFSDITPEEVKNDVIQKKWTGMHWTSGKVPGWVGSLGVALANLYEAHCYLGRSDSQDAHVAKPQVNLCFVGTEVDVEACLGMFEYLYTTINKLTNSYIKNASDVPEGKTRTYKNSFRLGAAKRLINRIREIANLNKEETTTETGTGLMVVKQQAIEMFLGCKASYSTKKSGSVTHAGAYLAGEIAGNSIGLNKQIS